jgi:hypothetical protein
MLPIMPAGNSSHKMRQYRERLRSQGLRPVQIWVPDCNAPNFQESIRQQIQHLNAIDEKEALEFIDRVAEDPTD